MGTGDIDDGPRYDAFISCENALPDRAIAEQLRGALEGYRAPGSLAKQGVPRRLKEVYLSREALSDFGDLGEATRRALRQSRYLIVVCSPRTPGSRRVAMEIDAFRDLGRGNSILTLLIEGEPEQSIPSLLREVRRTVVDEAGGTREVVEEIEPLAADIRAPNLSWSLRLLKTEKLRLIAPILGRGFDDLRRRHHERMVRYWSLVAAVGITVSSLFTGFSLVQWREAVEEERIAAEQQKMAEAAYAKLTRELPERFKDVPQALPVIQKTLEDNETLLEQLRREQSDPLQYVEELLTDNSPRDSERPGSEEGYGSEVGTGPVPGEAAAEPTARARRE